MMPAESIPLRSEYRLYYEGNAVTALMQAGDTFFVAIRPDNQVLVIITPAGSTVERQLAWLFGLGDVPEDDSRCARSTLAIRRRSILLPAM
jgi:hypothetical protein